MKSTVSPAARPTGSSQGGGDCPQYRHMGNRRIRHWLPARAKANANPHMHRSGYLEPARFTITTDETQESFCLLGGFLFAGLTSSFSCLPMRQDKLRGPGCGVNDKDSLTYMLPKSYRKIKGSFLTFLKWA